MSQHALSTLSSNCEFAVRPSVDPIMAWLKSSQVVSHHGEVYSWHSAKNPGYSYPEAAGLWLVAMCNAPFSEDGEQADIVAAWLAAQISGEGAVGRGEQRYLFDSAAALNGLVAHARYRQTDIHSDAMAVLFAFISSCVDHRRAVTPFPEKVDGIHWSTSYGSHQLKVVVGLQSYAEFSGQESPRMVASQIVRDQLSLFDGERFVIAPGSSLSYLHGCLYAFEGLACSRFENEGDPDGILGAGASWLAKIQRHSGGIPAFAEDGRSFGPCRSDATAQAVRLWSLLDREHWAESIASGLMFLGAQQDLSGGIRYADDCADVNTWASLFTVQALNWVDGEIAVCALI
jgi:hypothetical protein